MKKLLFPAALLSLLSACANEYSMPVTGTIGHEPAQGQFTARMDGNGDFFAITTSGLRCEGTYDSLTTQPTITAPVVCNDGRTGQLIVTRSTTRPGGTAIGRLNDGTQSRFVFGDLAFSQQLSDGSGALTR